MAEAVLLLLFSPDCAVCSCSQFPVPSSISIPKGTEQKRGQRRKPKREKDKKDFEKRIKEENHGDRIENIQIKGEV